MPNSGWSAERLNYTLPPGAVAPATFIYIGDAAGDPTGTLTVAGLDAGIVFAFGNGYAYVLGIFQEVGFNDAHLLFSGVDPFSAPGSQLHDMIFTDWQPPSAGGGSDELEYGNALSTTFVDGGARLQLEALIGNLSLVANGHIIATTGAQLITLGQTSTFPLLPDDVTNVDGALYVASNEVGRGCWMSIASTSSSAAIGAAAAVVLTLPSRTYVHGRAYRVYVKTGVSASVAGAFSDLRVVKGAVGGLGLGELYRTPCPTNAIVYAQHGFVEFTVGANDVTTQIVFTLSASAGTVTQFGGAGTPRFASVHDIGRASQYDANLPVLT